MAFPRWTVSLLLLVHLVSLSISAVPVESLLPEGPPSAASASVDSSGSALSRTLDQAADVVHAGARALSAVVAPVRPFTSRYMRAVSLASHWRMFSEPPRVAQYVRLRYHIGRDGAEAGPRGVNWVATELVVPGHREDRVRAAQGFIDSSLDKAAMVALDTFYRNRPPSAVRPDAASSDLPPDVAPLLRYFARRFERERLLPGERILRAEFWYGTAPVSPPGSATEAEVRRARSEILERYYAGPIESRIVSGTYPVYHALQTEGDISWVLEYFEP